MGYAAGDCSLTPEEASAFRIICLLRELENAKKTGMVDYRTLEEYEKTISKYSKNQDSGVRK